MWQEVHYNKQFGLYFLYAGSENGYTLQKAWSTKIMAMAWCKLHSIKFYG